MVHTAKKSFRYKGRALKPGDTFNPTRQHGRVLEATGQATRADLGTIAAPAPALVTKTVQEVKLGNARTPPSPELVAAREDYKAATGKRFFAGWSEAECRERIAAHHAAAAKAD